MKDEEKLVWIAKALILRGHRYANIIINKVLKDVKEEVKNQRVQILAENPPFAMTRASGARVKVTWRQRLFCTLWNERLCEDESLVILARWTPISVLRENQRDMDILTRVLVVLEKLQHSVDAARVMMKLLEGGTDTLVRVHTSKIIHVLVKCARTGRKEEQREIAIRCLEIMSELVPYHVLHPHKTEVLRGLKIVLDDRKRSVRRRAVRCVNRWEVLK